MEHIRVSSNDFRVNLHKILNAVAISGQVYVIERYGLPVARVVPISRPSEEGEQS